MKASKIREVLDKHDDLQAKIDRCGGLMDELWAGIKSAPIDSAGLQGMLYSAMSKGNLRLVLGDHLFKAVGPAVRRVIVNEKRRLMKEQRGLEV